MNKFLVFLMSLLVIDFFFLQVFMKQLYERHMGTRHVSLIFALLAYVAMASSWGLIKGDPRKAALVGFVVFGTYAFTLKALFPNYTNTMMLLETIWGPILFMLATWVTCNLTRA
jgi:uncharacterized membrane protein